MKKNELFDLKVQGASHFLPSSVNTDDKAAPIELKDGDIVDLPIKSIQIPFMIPRTLVEDEDQLRLAESIKEYDLINPITVSYKNGEFSLIAGRRRLHAVQSAGQEMIRCIVKHGDPLILSLIENLHRKNLTPIQEAEAVLQLKKSLGITQKALAKKLNKSTTNINDILRLNSLPALIKDSCRNNPEYSRRFFSEILKQKSPQKMIKYFKKISEPESQPSKNGEGENNPPQKTKQEILENNLVTAINAARKIAKNELKTDEIDKLNLLYEELGLVLGQLYAKKSRMRDFLSRIVNLISETGHR